jgi:hypothetical protein
VGKDNSANTIIKSVLNKAFEKFLDTNHLQIQVEGWVQRKEIEK